MKLFPDVHPATLHTVLAVNKNNFFLTVDKLLHAIRCKQQHSNQKDFSNKHCTENNLTNCWNINFQCRKRTHLNNDVVSVNDSFTCKCQYKNVKISDKSPQDLQEVRAKKILRTSTSQSKNSNSVESTINNPETGKVLILFARCRLQYKLKISMFMLSKYKTE